LGDYITISEQKTTAKTEAVCGMLLVLELAISHLLDALVQKGVVPVEEEADWISATRQRLRATREMRSIDGQIGVETLLDCLEASVRVSNPPPLPVSQDVAAHLLQGRLHVIPGGLIQQR